MKRTTPIRLLICLMLLTGFSRSVKAQDFYLGEIKLFAGNYAPNGWAKCEGQLLPISQNQALFAILGTTYGGNGTTTFALPDLRGRLPMGQGSGPGLTSTVVGEQQGTETVSLTVSNLPPHNHLMQVYNGSGNIDSLTSNTAYPALTLNPDLSRGAVYTTSAPNATLNTATLSSTGSGTSVPNKQPSLTLTYIIALVGIFPSP